MKKILITGETTFVSKYAEMLAYYESKGCDVRTFDEMCKSEM